MKKRITLAIDFDGTLVEHKYPKIGKEIPFAVDTVKMLHREGYRLILWTVREGPLLDEAVEWCKKRGLSFYAINRNYPEESIQDESYSRKLKADLFIDDRNIGGLPSWGMIYKMISQGMSFQEVILQSLGESKRLPKKKWFEFWK